MMCDLLGDTAKGYTAEQEYSADGRPYPCLPRTPVPVHTAMEEVDPITAFLDDYATQTFYTYRRHAETAARTCQNMLLREGLPGRVTYRVKDVRSLERKLRKREENRGSPYPDRGDIERDISDLAGIRVALCFPRHKDAVKRYIRRLFAVQREKKVIVGGESHARRFLGYCADHYRVFLRDEHIQFNEMLRGQTQQCRIEIQVISLLRHAWAEVEHDLVYKQPLSRTSPAEYRALDGLSGAIIMGERLLDRLYSPDNALPVGAVFETVFRVGCMASQRALGLAQGEEKESEEIQRIMRDFSKTLALERPRKALL